MEFDNSNGEELSKLQDILIQREREERIAAASLSSEILSQLNISTDALPQRCQQLLKQCSSLQAELGIEQLDPVAISLRQSRQISETMAEEYELLELRQKNQELQKQIDRISRFNEDLKRELQSSKESLANQTPNPDNIPEHIRQLKQKVALYEQVHEKAMAKFSKLHVPDAILPKSIEELVTRLVTLKLEEEELRLRADDITLARQARDTLNQLRRNTNL